MNTVHDRLKHWRESIEGVSLRELQGRVNRELPSDERVSLGTVSNYESAERGGGGPRAGFLAALKRAFPELRLAWLISGEGQPTVTAERLAAPEGLEGATGVQAGRGATFAGQVLGRYPDLELLSPEASALFMAALTRLAMGEPEMAFDEAQLLELAGDLRWLLFCPLSLWGFRHAPAYEELSDYAVALLHALMELMPPPGRGDPIARHADSAAPKLRRLHPVGLEN